MKLLDIDDILDSFTQWPGGCREYIRQKASDLHLGGYVQRTYSKNAEVVVEGTKADISAFIGALDELSKINLFSAVIHHGDQAKLQMRTYRDFKILKNLSKSCKKGHRSSGDHECSSSGSSADRTGCFGFSAVGC